MVEPLQLQYYYPLLLLAVSRCLSCISAEKKSFDAQEGNSFTGYISPDGGLRVGVEPWHDVLIIIVGLYGLVSGSWHDIDLLPIVGRIIRCWKQMPMMS